MSFDIVIAFFLEAKRLRFPLATDAVRAKHELILRNLTCFYLSRQPWVIYCCIKITLFCRTYSSVIGPFWQRLPTFYWHFLWSVARQVLHIENEFLPFWIWTSSWRFHCRPWNHEQAGGRVRVELATSIWRSWKERPIYHFHWWIRRYCS